MSEDNSTLFRKEAMLAARERLWGELLLRSPRIAKYAIPALVIGFVLLGVLLVKASFVRSESVQGYISTEAGWVRVFPPQEGRVQEVLVAEGDEVVADQVLARLINRRAIGSETFSESSLEIELRAQVAMLEEERLRERARQQEESAWYAQESQFLVERRSLLSSLHQVLAEQQQLRQAALGRGLKLQDAGSLAKSDVDILQQEYLAARAETLNASHTLLGLESMLRKHQAEKSSLPTQHYARLSSLNRDLSDLRQRLTELQGYSDYFVTAPVTGRVRGVTHSQGDQARKERPLFSILQEEKGIRAVLLVPSRAIGFVREGQRVRIRYDAFPYERFGSHEGEVTQVGRTSLVAGEISAPVPLREPVYRVYVKPLDSEVLANGETWALLPGMTLQAEVQLETRTLWQWLTAPLRSLARQ